MSVHDVRFDGAVSWPSNGLSEVPFRVYTDPQQYAHEQETIFKGESWSYLCLANEIPNSGDWVATTVGEVAVVVARGEDSAINAFVNRCAHRGNLLCLKNRGHNREITCIYHGWSYDLTGQLTGVAFEKGVKRQGGMAPEFHKEEHHLQRLRVEELLSPSSLTTTARNSCDSRAPPSPHRVVAHERVPRPSGRPSGQLAAAPASLVSTAACRSTFSW